MFTKFTKLVVVAVLAVFALLTVAEAQSKPQTRPPTMPRSIELSTLRPGNHSGRSMTDSSGIVPDFSVGWNYMHPQNCTSYYYNGVFYTVVYPREGGYIYTSDVNFLQQLAAACQTGNWLAIYFYDSFGDWDETDTYTYR